MSTAESSTAATSSSNSSDNNATTYNADALVMEQALHHQAFTFIVFGASGDLAKKKTFPALFALFSQGLIPCNVNIIGFARSEMSRDQFTTLYRDVLKKKLGNMSTSSTTSCVPGSPEVILNAFLDRCHYVYGKYNEPAAFQRLHRLARRLEIASLQCTASSTSSASSDTCPAHPSNVDIDTPLAQAEEEVASSRIFYFALPPSVYDDVATNVKPYSFSKTGFNRIIVEKPFGRDLQSFRDLNAKLSTMFTEDQIYRIDHFLGKEIVQNLLTLRFANIMFEPLFHRHYVKSVTITFKEDIDLQGRGGYFDEFGIIRDVIQNHLMQILALVAMEPPASLEAEDIRDEKVKVLKQIDPLTIDRLVIGQFTKSADGKKGAYLDDKTVPADSVTPTFASCVLYINNARWQGVPFILKAGKALDERKSEIRIQFSSPAGRLFDQSYCRPAADGTQDVVCSAPVPNELVLRVQPNEAIYLKILSKKPGLQNDLILSDLDLTYKSRGLPVQYDAYERLILDVIRSDRSLFVRSDELEHSWKIFTPILQYLEKNKIRPVPYPAGVRAPPEADQLAAKHGFVKVDYSHWQPPKY